MLGPALGSAAELSRQFASTPGLEWIYEKLAGSFAFFFVSIAVATAPAAPLLLPWLLTYAAGTTVGLTHTTAVLLSVAVGIACAGKLTLWQLSWFEHEDATRMNMRALGLAAAVGCVWVVLLTEGAWWVIFDKGFWLRGGPRWLATLPSFVSFPLGWVAQGYPILTGLVSICLDLGLLIVTAWTAAYGWAMWVAGAATFVLWDGKGTRARMKP